MSPESWQQKSHRVTWSSGVVVFLLIVFVCVMFHHEIRAFFSKKWNTKGAKQPEPPREGIIPLYHEKRTSVESHQKQGDVMAESEGQKVAASTKQVSPPAAVTPS
jgi:hypothetical protein